MRVFFFLLIFLSIALFFHDPAHAACTDPDAVPGELMYNQDAGVFQGCTRRGWFAFHAPPPPPPCIDPGDTCPDGTIYAGLSQDGNIPMYAMPADAPGGASYSWNNGTSTWLDTALINCTSASQSYCNTGEADTAYLAAISSPSPAPYRAAQYCANLISNGHDDWYLPSANELKPLRALYVAGQGGFSGNTYWGSTEWSDRNGWAMVFSSGYLTYWTKNNTYRVRCVRK